MAHDPVSQHGDVVEIALFIQPRASRTRVVGLHGDDLKLQLAAPPVDGEANRELVAFLAKRLKVAKSAVEISAGLNSRHKKVQVTGVDIAVVRGILLDESEKK
jgi:hypothetical protein